jgi:hypothetical protein
MPGSPPSPGSMRWSATTISTSVSNAPLNDDTGQESDRLNEEATLARELG